MLIADWIADHSLYILLGIGTIFTYVWIFSFRKKLNMHWFPLLIYSIIHTIFGVLCVTVFALAEAGFNMDAAGNMSLYGGVFFMPVFTDFGISRQRGRNKRFCKGGSRNMR